MNQENDFFKIKAVFDKMLSEKGFRLLILLGFLFPSVIWLYNTIKENGRMEYALEDMTKKTGLLETEKENLIKENSALGDRLAKFEIDSLSQINQKQGVSEQPESIHMKGNVLNDKVLSIQSGTKPNEFLRFEKIIERFNKENMELRLYNKRLFEKNSKLRDANNAMQNYISSRELWSGKMSDIVDAMHTASPKERKELERAFNEIIKVMDEEKLKFERSKEGKEVKKVIELANQVFFKQQDSIIHRLQDSIAALNKIITLTELSSEITGDADKIYTDATGILKEAEDIFTVFAFGVNGKVRCNLIRQVLEKYGEANKLGRDCKEEIKNLEQKYSDCIKKR